MKKHSSRSLVIGICGLLLATFGLWQMGSTVLAEQSGSSPESGATSRIKIAYDWLVAKGANYGVTDASDWSNNWGSLWNRIMESATWEPDGTATEADVASTKTFYAGNSDRTIKTGTASPAFDYSTQSKVIWDDNKNGGSADGDSALEESAWINSAGNATTGVWKDTRTGLYWSNSQGNMSNLFTVVSCDYFSTSPRGSYTGEDSDCGLAINYCANLNLTSGGASSTDWYLPSRTELLQGFLDGIYNQTHTDFVTTNYFWSSTEDSVAAVYAWNLYLQYHIRSENDYKDSVYSVRCVRRD